MLFLIHHVFIMDDENETIENKNGPPRNLKIDNYVGFLFIR